MSLVLITRPEPDASKFATQCEKAWLSPILAPLLRVQFREKPLTTDRFSALAFTSANGVRAFAALSPDRSLRAYCVGASTAASAQEACFDDVITADGDVQSLADAIAQRQKGGKILHPAGVRRAGDLVGLLRDCGIEAELQIVYETIEAETLPTAAAEALAGETPAYIPLFSPRTAQLLARLIRKAGLADELRRHIGVFLSPVVASVAKDLPWRGKRIARERTAAAMIALMTQRA